MSMTATISVSPSSVYINQPSVATLTISNSGAAAINMLSITPYAFTTSDAAQRPAPMALASLPLAPGSVISVGASGTLVFKFNIIPQASSGSGTYSVGAYCQSQDGQLFRPTIATITCLPFPQPESSNT